MSGCEDDRNMILDDLFNKKYAMFVFKNLFSGLYRNKRSLQFRTSSIVVPVVDEECKDYLESVGDFWRMIKEVRKITFMDIYVHKEINICRYFILNRLLLLK